MHRCQAPIHYPCTADFGSMPRAGEGRYCRACDTVVVDLSALGERAAREKLREAHERGERVCIRYVYDAHGGIVFGDAADRARIVPEHALTRRLKRAVALAATAAVPLLVQACGGNGGGFEWPADSGADADDSDAADAPTTPRDAGNAD